MLRNRFPGFVDETRETVSQQQSSQQILRVKFTKARKLPVERCMLMPSKSAWCNSPSLLVPYTAQIAAILEKHGEPTMEKIWQPEYKVDVP